ncbi:NSFL1 cofactor p47 [Glossina fuscipes fuscipes]
MADRDELVSQFIEISGSDENVARFYLSSCNWSLEDALSNFLGNQADNEEDVTTIDVTGITPEQLVASLGQVKTTNSSDYFGKNVSTTKAKFATLKDMSNKAGENDEEEGQAFYAGGSDRSGQQVLGPPKRKNFREQLTEMFRMAQENIANVEGSGAASTSSGANWGNTGIRLGMTNTDHSVVAPAKKDNANKKPVVVLKLWSQGFSVDDGELRHYDNPQNKEFLETVMRGEIPQELLDMGWVVNVDVEDHRQEDFKKPASAVKLFKGSGHALGSPAPIVTENTETPATAGNDASDESSAKEKLKLDSAQPITTLQIRLADGTRLAAQFNLNHTVGDILTYIQTARPQYAERNFILVSSFPTRELSDTTETIEAAGLKNAALMQRLN